MLDTFKFPNGNDVTVVRKQDVLDCIDANIIDKEIALEIVTMCELDANNFIREGRWTGIPFMGNIRKSKYIQLQEEQKELVAEAKENLSPERYVLFRKNLAIDNGKRAKAEKYYRYIVSQIVTKNRALFNSLCDEKGEPYARFILFAYSSIEPVDRKYLNPNIDE